MKFKKKQLGWLVFSISAAQVAHADEPYVLSADGSAVVRRVPQGVASAGSLDTSLLSNGFTAAAGTGGSLSVQDYTPGFRGGNGGVQFKATFNSNLPALPAAQRIEWVQTINTNLPLQGTATKYLDNALNTSVPFYSLTAQNRSPGLAANATSMNFYDYSTRSPLSLATTNPITWNANLYPVITDGSKSLAVYNGVSWGWTMKKAPIGSTVGTFLNPSSGGVTTGVGTSKITWGVGDPSSLSFTPSNFDTKPGTPFKVGSLTFHNGTIANNSGISAVGFDIGFNLDNVPEKNFVFNTQFGIVNTPNVEDDPAASADFITNPKIGATFNTLEDETATVDIIGMLTTGLTARNVFTQPSGAALVSDEPFDPSGDFIFTLLGFQNASSGGFIGGSGDTPVTGEVPEPDTLSLLILCLGILWQMQRRTKALH
jgi:hypothetical protein